MDYLAQYTEAELMMHGRMRLLRSERRKHERALQGAVQHIQRETIRALCSLTDGTYIAPLDHEHIRRHYKVARVADRHITEIDRMRVDIINEAKGKA